MVNEPRDLEKISFESRVGVVSGETESIEMCP
jgi:hypothetical protein